MDPNHPQHNGEFTYYSFLYGGFKGDEAHKVEHVKALDEYTVEIKLTEPTAPFISYLAIPMFGIASPEAIQKNEDYYVDGIPHLDQLIFRVIPDNSSRPCVKLADKSLISHPLISQHLIKLANERNIPYQEEVFMGIGTDAGAIHLTGEGVTTGALSIPSRYTHSPHEVVDLNDLKNSRDLLLSFITSLDQLKGKDFLDT
ncbi:hypothetical protein ABFG93_16590 [Pseudalkalibacillus hwajinpoensis]|uniref:hypothetical protein n=1 Tax=Guptibacillus hwajinpoensis TaxID=208199 RepID=UPI00325BEE69